METITAYLPEIGGAVIWLVISIVNYVTPHHSDMSPGWRKVAVWLAHFMAFLDRSGWFKVLKVPVVHWPKPLTDITDIQQGSATTPGKEKSE